MIFNVISIDVMVFQNNALAPERGVPNVFVNVFQLAIGRIAPDEMRIWQTKDVGQRVTLDCQNLDLLSL